MTTASPRRFFSAILAAAAAVLTIVGAAPSQAQPATYYGYSAQPTYGGYSSYGSPAAAASSMGYYYQTPGYASTSRGYTGSAQSQSSSRSRTPTYAYSPYGGTDYGYGNGYGVAPSAAYSYSYGGYADQSAYGRGTGEGFNADGSQSYHPFYYGGAPNSGYSMEEPAPNTPIEINLSSRSGRFGSYTFAALGAGRKSTTPTGTFTVQWKAKDFYSKKYDAPMPYSLFFTDQCAIHAGELDVHSHGCIHVDDDTAQYLFRYAKAGQTKVIVRP